MDLSHIRSEIDRIDTEMVRLFEERMKLACGVAEYKKANHLPVYDSGRERQVVNQLAEKIDPAFERYMRMLYTTMFAVSRSYQHQKIQSESELTKALVEIIQQPPRPFPAKAVVACQGVEGSHLTSATVHYGK